MRFACFVLLLSAVAISAESKVTKPPSLTETQEFQGIVDYLNNYVSPNDIQEMLDTIPEALTEETSDEDDSVAMPRSVGSVIGNVFDRIPWEKITDYVKKMAKNNPKFTKVLNLISDQKFRDLVKKAVNSHTLGEFVKDVAAHGFNWTEFLHLLLHALCSTATTIQHDKYSVGVCQVLQNL